ncbi:hypothetical protein DM01DRAFT_260490, partial [Hesseltinella vesiculosa]
SANGDNSELTFCRRFAGLLDILYDGADIVLDDGEHVCQATKSSIDLNRCLFDDTSLIPSYGRKIDLLLKSSGPKKIEPSSNEWKRASVTGVLKSKQLCKNIRTNACIIDHFHALVANVDEVISLDFVGNTGILFMVKKTKGKYFITKVMAKLVIPNSISQIGTLQPTLDALLRMKVKKPFFFFV